MEKPTGWPQFVIRDGRKVLQFEVKHEDGRKEWRDVPTRDDEYPDENGQG